MLKFRWVHLPVGFSQIYHQRFQIKWLKYSFNSIKNVCHTTQLMCTISMNLYHKYFQIHKHVATTQLVHSTLSHFPL